MQSLKPFLALSGALALGACAVAPPAGPSVMALPGQNKNFAAFQQDDGVCRQYAGAQTGYANPSQAATNSGIASAAVGTGIGAAAGAVLGAAAGNPGAGAAIGAGSGLLLGSAVGANNAQLSAAGLQQRYDMTYTQCMVAHGDRVTAGPGGAAPYGGYAYAPYGYYGYPGYYGGYYGPEIALGFGGGWGGGWHGGWHDGGGWRGGGWHGGDGGWRR